MNYLYFLENLEFKERSDLQEGTLLGLRISFIFFFLKLFKKIKKKKS